MSLIAKQLLIVWRRCFDSFKVVVIKTNIVLIEHCFSTSGKPPKSIKYNCTIKIYSIHQKINHFLREE